METKETNDLLYRNQLIFKEAKARWKNVTVVWIDYKQAYYMAPQTWIIERLKGYKISNKVIMKAMQNWKVELTSGGQTRAEVKIERNIFQENSLIALLFVVAMMTLNYVLKNLHETTHL